MMSRLMIFLKMKKWLLRKMVSEILSKEGRKFW